MSKKVFVKSFGCQMNEYDSKKIEDILKDGLMHLKQQMYHRQIHQRMQI